MTRTALVTGATSGIGLSLCRQLHASGVRVFATGRSEAVLDSLQTELGCAGATFDLSDPDAPAQLYAEACAQLGESPQILVNNAGYNSRKAALIDVTTEELDEQWRVNLRAPTLLAQLALRDMAARKSGHIVNVVSTVVHLGLETMGAYSTMKMGLLGLTRVLIKEARPHGVKVTAVHPGGTDSGFRAAERPDYMRPESVAHMIVGILTAPEDVVVHELTFRPLVEVNF